MKIKITRDTHGFKVGDIETVTAGRAGNMIAGNFAVEHGENSLALSTLGKLNKRQLMGLAKGRGVEGYLAMKPVNLVAAIVNVKTNPEVKKTVKKKAKAKKNK